jgi:hypothetical protein
MKTAGANMSKKRQKIILISITIGFLITGLSFIIPRDGYNGGISCESPNSDFTSAATSINRGFPFSYHKVVRDSLNNKCLVLQETRTDCGPTSLCEPNNHYEPVGASFLPKQFIADVLIWSLAAFVVLALTPKAGKKK